jgi:hypothetical protein
MEEDGGGNSVWGGGDGEEEGKGGTGRWKMGKKEMEIG